jgi:hypothetical protein
VGCIIDLTGSDLEGRHIPVEEEIEGMEEEDLEEHRVEQDSIASVRHEEDRGSLHGRGFVRVSS